MKIKQEVKRKEVSNILIIGIMLIIIILLILIPISLVAQGGGGGGDSNETQQLQEELANLTSYLSEQGYSYSVNCQVNKFKNNDNLMLSIDNKILTS